MTPLEPGFEPTEADVICSRGRSAFNHAGNVRFRGIIADNVEKYKGATSKQQKTAVVNSLLEEFQATSRFVRKQDDGKWVDVPEHVAKEKIGQGFRDILHTEYRSSTKSKVKLRRERRRRQRGLKEPGADSGVTLGLGLTRSSSSESLEPLPLDQPASSSSGEALIYDYPFAFAPPKDEGQATGNDGAVDDTEDDGVHTDEEDKKLPAKQESSKHDDERSSRRHDEPQGTGPTFVTPKSPPVHHSVAQHGRSHSLDSHAPAAGVSPARCPDSWEQYRRPRPYFPPQAGYSPSTYAPMRYYYPSGSYHSPPSAQHPRPPPPPYPGTHYRPPPDVPSSPARRPDWDAYSHGRSPPRPPPPSGSYYASPYRSWGEEPASRDRPLPASTTRDDPDNESQSRPPEGQASGDYYHPPYPYPPYPPYPPPPPPPPPPRW